MAALPKQSKMDQLWKKVNNSIGSSTSRRKISGSKQHNLLPHLEQLPPNIYLETDHIIWWDGTTGHGNYIAKNPPPKKQKTPNPFFRTGQSDEIQTAPPDGVDYIYIYKHVVSINSPKSQRSYRFYRDGCLEQNHQTFRSEFDARKKKDAIWRSF